MGNSTREGKPGRHFTERLHHAEDGDTRECVAEQDGDRTSIGESGANTEEQTSTDRSAERNELDVPRLEPRGDQPKVFRWYCL